MNNKKLIIKIASALCIAVVISTTHSCIKDNFDFDKLQKPEWNPNFAVPLVYSSLTLQELITNNNNGMITVGSDNFCTLIYKGNLLSLSAAELMEIPSNTPPPFDSPTLSASEIAALSIPATVTFPFSQIVDFDAGVNGPKIDSVTFKTGSLDISLNSDFKYNGQIVLTIPSAKKNGIVFSKTIPHTYSGAPVTAQMSCDLAGYTFDMTNGGTTSNKFPVNFSITLTSTGIPPLSTDKITISQSLVNMKFSRLFGDIGTQSLAPDVDTVELDFFKSALGSGSFSMVDPRVKLVISNSYGVPINSSFSQFGGYNPGIGFIPITGCPSPLPIWSPNFSEIGQSKTDSFSLSIATGSNIASVVNNLPKFLIFKLNAQSNPAGPTHNNFVLDTSQIKVDLEFELPLWGSAKDFILMDTVNFKLDMSAANDMVDYALLRTFNSNGFPLDIGMQIYFADSLYAKLDSLLVSNQLILQSGVVDASSGKVISPTPSTFDVVFTKSKLEAIKTAKYLIVKGSASTTNGGNTNIKIYSDYKIDVKLGMQVKLKL